MSLSYPIPVDYVLSICLANSMVWILRCEARGMRHFVQALPCMALAGLNSAKASSSVSLTDLVDAQRCGTRALLHQVGHETSLLQSLQNDTVE